MATHGVAGLDDTKFVDVAIAAGADCIVSNDRHFKVLQQIEFPKARTVTLQEFLQAMS